MDCWINCWSGLADATTYYPLMEQSTAVDSGGPKTSSAEPTVSLLNLVDTIVGSTHSIPASPSPIKGTSKLLSFMPRYTPTTFSGIPALTALGAHVCVAAKLAGQ